MVCESASCSPTRSRRARLRAARGTSRPSGARSSSRPRSTPVQSTSVSSTCSSSGPQAIARRERAHDALELRDLGGREGDVGRRRSPRSRAHATAGERRRAARGACRRAASRAASRRGVLEAARGVAVACARSRDGRRRRARGRAIRAAQATSTERAELAPSTAASRVACAGRRATALRPRAPPLPARRRPARASARPRPTRRCARRRWRPGAHTSSRSGASGSRSLAPGRPSSRCVRLDGPRARLRIARGAHLDLGPARVAPRRGSSRGLEARARAPLPRPRRRRGRRRCVAATPPARARRAPPAQGGRGAPRAAPRASRWRGRGPRSPGVGRGGGLARQVRRLVDDGPGARRELHGAPEGARAPGPSAPARARASPATASSRACASAVDAAPTSARVERPQPGVVGAPPPGDERADLGGRRPARPLETAARPRRGRARPTRGARAWPGRSSATSPSSASMALGGGAPASSRSPRRRAISARRASPSGPSTPASATQARPVSPARASADASCTASVGVARPRATSSSASAMASGSGRGARELAHQARGPLRPSATRHVDRATLAAPEHVLERPRRRLALARQLDDARDERALAALVLASERPRRGARRRPAPRASATAARHPSGSTIARRRAAVGSPETASRRPEPRASRGPPRADCHARAGSPTRGDTAPPRAMSPARSREVRPAHAIDPRAGPPRARRRGARAGAPLARDPRRAGPAPGRAARGAPSPSAPARSRHAVHAATAARGIGRRARRPGRGSRRARRPSAHRSGGGPALAALAQLGRRVAGRAAEGAGADVARREPQVDERRAAIVGGVARGRAACVADGAQSTFAGLTSP